ncbi:MAG: hypothetical protein KAH30_07040 [Caldisericia bacterium]|nr:hypothetical protein [Caldisericia bacterium]
MAKIQLSTIVKLDISEDGKITRSFSVTFREPSKKQQKEIGKENKTILDLFKVSQKLERRIEATEAKVEALKSMDKATELLSTAKKLDDLYSQIDEVETQFDSLGGYDQMMEASKLSFEKAIGGKDKEDLRVFIDEFSDYTTILNAISNDAKEQRGK